MLVSVSCQLHSNFYYWNLWAQKWFSTQFFLLSPLSFLVGFSCFRLFLFPFLLCSNCCLLGHAGWWPWLPERVGMDGGDPGQTRANCSSVIGNCFSIFVCHLSRRQLRWNFFLFFFATCAPGYKSNADLLCGFIWMAEDATQICEEKHAEKIEHFLWRLCSFNGALHFYINVELKCLK